MYPLSLDCGVGYTLEIAPWLPPLAGSSSQWADLQLRGLLGPQVKHARQDPTERRTFSAKRHLQTKARIIAMVITVLVTTTSAVFLRLKYLFWACRST